MLWDGCGAFLLLSILKARHISIHIHFHSLFDYRNSYIAINTHSIAEINTLTSIYVSLSLLRSLFPYIDYLVVLFVFAKSHATYIESQNHSGTYKSTQIRVEAYVNEQQFLRK